MTRKYRKWDQEDHEEFVRTWQTSESVQAVADALGLSKPHVANQATNLRKKNVPLKRMNPPKPRIDYQALAELAERLEKEGNDD